MNRRFTLFKHSVVLILLLNLLAAGGKAFELKGKQWQVSIDPRTLGVTCTTREGARLVISIPRTDSQDVSDLQEDGGSAGWNLREAKLHVDVRLDDGDALHVQFIAVENGSLTWPTLGPDPAYRGYIVPIFEGLYVPAGDREWSNFLVGEGPRDTAGGLSMPFWGVDVGGHTLTYILTNPLNNEVRFHNEGGRLGITVVHQFTANVEKKQFGFTIRLAGGSPVEPAKIYRDELIRHGDFVTLKQKIQRTPDAAKLLGAAHVYLWGEESIGRDDLKSAKPLAKRIFDSQNQPTIAGRIFALMTPEERKLLADLVAKQWADNYDKSQFASALSAILRRRNFYTESMNGLSKDAEANRLIAVGISTLSDAQVCQLNCLLMREAFADLLPPVETWGEGWSAKMIQLLADGGLDRLWLGSPNWDGLRLHPEAVQKAISLGYLVGPYDSFHSIHSPTDADTWETAQFDRALYENGPVVMADGRKKKGFRQKGYILSDVAAGPAVEKRVTELMRQFNCNSWFIDCDADGELYDDYSPLHPATQADQMNARLKRLAWIRDTFHAVIGSEGGAAYAAGAIHFAHGMMTPVIGWGDPDLKNRSSPYFLGGYYPPDAPAVFFKQVPMKPLYRRIYADPWFRLPLYETVFHDSVVATHQWGYGSLKFSDEDHARELLELLYDVPPLYHLNPSEWEKRKELIRSHYQFFSPLHRQAGLLAMTDFQCLTDDRLVQRTTFGDALEMVANFGGEAFGYQGNSIPRRSILARWMKTGETQVYTPK